MLMCAVSILVGAPRNYNRFVCWSVRFLLGRLRFSLRTHTSVLLNEYSTRIQYVALAIPIILSDAGEQMHRDKIPPPRMHAACRIVTRGSCYTKRFAEVNSNCESYCRLEQLVASLSAADEENLLPVRIIRRQKATPEDTGTNHPVCCIVGALGLE